MMINDFTGGHDGIRIYNYILQYHPDSASWTQVGQMKHGRSLHGASLVDVDDIIDYCQV